MARKASAESVLRARLILLQDHGMSLGEAASALGVDYDRARMVLGRMRRRRGKPPTKPIIVGKRVRRPAEAPCLSAALLDELRAWMAQHRAVGAGSFDKVFERLRYPAKIVWGALELAKTGLNEIPNRATVDAEDDEFED